MKDLKVVSTAGLLAGLIWVLSIFQQEIDVASKWWLSIPDFFLGVLAGSVAYGAEKKLHSLSMSGFGASFIVHFLTCAAGMFLVLRFSVYPSVIAFLIGVFLSLAMLFPAIDTNKDDD